MINKEPYGTKIDCWAFGCILYGMVVGHPPFESSSVQETLNKIKNMSFDYPNYISDTLKNLLKSLLQPVYIYFIYNI